jgi:hypothetical protein
LTSATDGVYRSTLFPGHRPAEAIWLGGTAQWSALFIAVHAIILSLFGERMKEDLAQLLSHLSPAEQSAVKEFIVFLKERSGKAPPTSFLAALDEFIANHPELLRRLAQ